MLYKNIKIVNLTQLNFTHLVLDRFEIKRAKMCALICYFWIKKAYWQNKMPLYKMCYYQKNWHIVWTHSHDKHVIVLTFKVDRCRKQENSSVNQCLSGTSTSLICFLMFWFYAQVNFCYCHSYLKKMILASKVVKNDPKVIISLC